MLAGRNATSTKVRPQCPEGGDPRYDGPPPRTYIGRDTVQKVKALIPYTLTPGARLVEDWLVSN